MKKNLLILSLCFLFFYSPSQTIKFNKEYPIWNEFEMNNFQQTNDGGYILNSDAMPEMDTAVSQKGYGYLVKMTAQGQTQWIKKYPKTNFFRKSSDGNSVYQTNDGGYIIGTVQYVYTNPSNYVGSAFIYLIKTDVSGNVLWSKTYQGIGNATCYCVKQTADLGYIISGNTVDTVNTIQYTFLMKTDNAGNIQWGKMYSEAAGGQGGNAYDVKQTSDGGYIVSGDSYSGAFIMKTDNNGNILWCNNFGSPGSDGLYCAQQTSDGGYIATGFGSLSSYGAATLLKFDASGSAQWEKIYSSSTSAYDEGYSVQEMQNGFAVLLNNGSQNCLMKTDSSGNVQWAMQYINGFESAPSALNKTTDGGFAFVSTYYGNSTMGIAVTKTDSLGNLNCGDSAITLTDTIYSPAINPGFIVATISPQNIVNTVFANVSLNDSLLCPQNIDNGIYSSHFENSVSIFPNPTSGNFSLTINQLSGEDIDFKIYDVLGKIILQKKEKNIFGELDENFDLSEMSAGIYFVEVKIGNEIALAKKIVKE